MRTLNNYLALTGVSILLLMEIGCSRNANEAALPSKESTENSVQLVDVTEAKQLIAAGQLIILDVRTPEEFITGHIAGAKNLNFYDGDFRANLQQLDKGESYLVHCKSGRRSAQAGTIMKQLGFKSVYDLAGGISAWEQANQEIIK
jgi:rhodanese-related sulfurtransferase